MASIAAIHRFALERENVLCDAFGLRLGKPGVAFLEIILRFGQSMARDKPTSDQRKKQSNDHAIFPLAFECTLWLSTQCCWMSLPSGSSRMALN